MEPGSGVALCPRCGRTDEVALAQPLFVVTGASGSGKTTVFGPLARRLGNRCVAFDVDWLLDAAGALSGAKSVAEIPWEGFFQAWLSVAHAVAQSGLPSLLLGPLVPDRLADSPPRRWIGDIHALVLDCPDEIRKARIESRPPWRSRDVAEQVSFGRWLRDNIPDRIDTSACSPEEAAAQIVSWVEDHL